MEVFRFRAHKRNLDLGFLTVFGLRSNQGFRVWGNITVM